MKRTKYLLIFSVSILVLFFWWWIRTESEHSAGAQRPEVRHNLDRKLPDSGAPEWIPKPVDATREQGRNIDEENERNYADFLNIPIVFYGRVLDQDSKPLVGVEVNPEVTRATNLVEHYSGTNAVTKCPTVITDTYGQFSLQGQRGFLLTFQLSKEGYRSRGGGASFDRRLPSCHKPDRNNPVEFTLISSYIPKARKVLSERQRFAWNSGLVTVDLGAKIGQLLVLPTRRRDKPSEIRNFAWNIELRAKGFGLAVIKDAAQVLAPTQGYLADYHDGALATDKPWNSGIHKKFAIRTAGNQYGILELEIDSYGDDDKTSCWITLYLNESGSRNVDHD